ncbi:MAG: hypothetical protein K6E50_11470 [Lachnospiraceae bacterium]|nr:hypothetical protein [Lachnospiraceae bacterium]
MTEKNEKKKTDPQALVLTMGWLILLGWRIYVLIRYSYCYTDDDQTLMWYGTVHFAHGHFPEPCFFGQDYGSMWESLLAVPLYLMGWPLYVALPTVSMLWGFFPFVLLSVSAYRGRRPHVAFGILLLAAGCGWAWDVLTSVPRSFIPGLPFAVLAVKLLWDEKAGFWKKLLAAFLGMIGFVMTETALIILALGIFRMILKEKKEWFTKGSWLPVLLGTAAGGCVYGARCLFYVLQPEYALYHVAGGGFSAEVFLRNLSVLPARFSEYCFAGKAGVVLIPLFLILLLVFCFAKGRKETAWLLLASVAASILMLGLSRSYGYDDDSLLYGQLRMLLFWAYLAVLIPDSMRSEGAGKEMSHLFCGAALLLLCLILACKGFLFERALADPDSMVWKASFIAMMRTDELQKQTGMLKEAVRQSGADVAICTSYARVLAYGAAALCYEEPVTFYVPDKDRRFWVWQEMAEKRAHRILFYSVPVGGEDCFSLLELDEEHPPVRYFEEEYGLGRDSELEWGNRW